MLDDSRLGAPLSGQDAAGLPADALAASQSAAATLAARERRHGGSGRAARQMTSLAQRFRDSGLDWRADFADAIRARQWRRIDLWVRLMPYLLTGGKKERPNAPRGKRRLTRAALAKLKELEGRGV